MVEMLSPTPPRKFTRSITSTELENIVVDEWVIEDVIPSGPRTVLLVGDSNTGKTFVALDIAMHLICGMSNWHGKPIDTDNSGRVLYLTGEGETSLPKRLAGWFQDKGLALKAIEGKFDILDMDEGEGLVMDGSDTFKDFLGSIKGQGYSVAFVDTLSLFSFGDENSNEDMADFVGHLKSIASAINGPVVCLHHTLKYDGTTFRGASALRCNVDNLYSLTEVEKSTTLCLMADKNRDGAKGEESAVYLNKRVVEIEGLCSKSGRPVTTLVLDSVSKEDVKTIESALIKDDNLQKLDNLLSEHFANLELEDGIFSFSRESMKSWLLESGMDNDKANRQSKSSSDGLAGRCVKKQYLNWDEDAEKYTVNTVSNWLWGFPFVFFASDREQRVAECCPVAL